MTLLVFGKTGQVARELQQQANVLALGREQADLCDPEACAAAIRQHRPKAVINAAAYTAVDQAENDEALATLINGDAPAAMAQACVDLEIPLVHISTDYVFAGTGMTPWVPSAPTAPLNAYGRSKLAGETGIRNTGGPHVILRTSWVFSKHGTNFLNTMLRLGRESQKLEIVEDQIGGPTPAADVATACVHIARQLVADPGKSGTYHFSGSPDVSWFGFAQEIFSQAAIRCQLRRIKTVNYPTLAGRPLNSRLDSRSTGTVFNIVRPDWRNGLAAILRKP